ncbi:armadillo repeat-containing protein LFR-like [Salvia divinorum]|uniref:Armadillo repeat-containing protein LFR-like n=1 Tax=Salvia divinorum TaxID=28513 RepID=A0ABD1FYR3_SALDI
MHMREQSKPGGAAGDSAPPAAKRGRPIGIGSNSAALLLLRQLWLQLPVIPSHPPPSSALRSRSTPPSRVGGLRKMASLTLMMKAGRKAAVICHCLETMFQCLEDYVTEEEELVTNCLETIMNLGPLLDLRIFSSSKPSFIKMTEKRALQAIMGMLGSAVRGWHSAAAVCSTGHSVFPAGDAQAAAVGALYNLAEANMDCRLNLARERWAVDRLLKLIKTPHPVPEVCRKAALIL